MTPRSRRLLAALPLALLTSLALAAAVPIAARSLRSCFPPAPPPRPALSAAGGLPLLGQYFTTLPPAPLLFTSAFTHINQADLNGIRPVDRTGIPFWAAVVQDPEPYDSVTTVASGWPMKCLAVEFWHTRSGAEHPRGWRLTVDGAAPESSTIPLTPLPLGLLANTTLFTLPAYALLSLPILRLSWWRQDRRLRRGLCPACAYDLHWNLAPGCPECGWRRSSTGFQPVSSPLPLPEGGGRGVGS